MKTGRKRAEGVRVETINRTASKGAPLKEGEGSTAKGKEENETGRREGFSICGVTAVME